MANGDSKDSSKRIIAEGASWPVFFLDASCKVIWMNRSALSELEVLGVSLCNRDLADVLDAFDVKLEDVGEALRYIDEGRSGDLDFEDGRWASLSIHFVAREACEGKDTVVSLKRHDISVTSSGPQEEKKFEKSNLRVAVVDDNQVSLEIARRLLVRLGYDPRDFSNANDVIEANQEASFDLVVTDLRMPEVDGLELCQTLKATGSIKVIALTASDSVHDQKNCLEAGMDGYILKPVTLDNLAKGIDLTLSGGRYFPSLGFADKADMSWDEIELINTDDWQDDPDLHKRMLSLLFDDAPGALEAIDAAWNSRDAKAFEERIHYFKGSVDVVRADRLASICQTLLEWTRHGQMMKSESVLPVLRKAFEDTKAYAMKAGLTRESSD